MATFTLDNLPDDLMAQIKQLASQNNQTINELMSKASISHSSNVNKCVIINDCHLIPTT
ncbi:MAG: hypothetical protein F6K41_06190 [Symploca sp. SIO3E6]|nr:hypothetical protein [Caldora sp. SIO3E6]